ncbi:pyrimidine reductase family protein [Saccharopolyspora rhizosphaerae]|uniref:Pyrimidine reductase family protein n=1 Tax=Saccharopolyspora rhizosphaerae TaxID=2492662 RepID=A0A426JJ03_9PSEU|nr:dihydrofolate reductase family protein [Saccharopolyspora rhizosphaerae]RRO13145.1 pyrimidine reductase family protein [Saccharopolyspora rhizosphaerae]
MRQLWPDAATLDDRQLEDLYTYPADERWLVVNFVSSADGAVELDGTARGLSTPADQEVLKLGSDLADVMLVGATTAMAEGFRGKHPDTATRERRLRHGLSEVPPTAVVTSGDSLPADAPVITEAETPTIVITCATAPGEKLNAWREAGADLLITGMGSVNLATATKSLAERGLRHVDCEGGPHLFGGLLAAGLVDELRLTVSPMLVSGSHSRIATGELFDTLELELASVVSEEGAMMMRYLVQS